MSAGESNDRDGKASQMMAAGLIIGALVGFLLRPSIPMIGQLPLVTMAELVTTGGEGLEQLFVPLAQRSFMYMMVGGIIGGFLGWLGAQVAGGSLGQTAAGTDPGLRPCPFCAEPIQPQAKICRFCNRSLDAALG